MWPPLPWTPCATCRATPLGSTISTTAPSPRIVLPANIGMCRSFTDIGFTTISSVWKTSSTRMPKRSPPDLRDHHEARLLRPPPGLDCPSRPVSETIGSSRSRRRSTGAPLMCSTRCAPASTRTSSSTATCGRAKRCSPARTIRAATMASVSGILMVKVVPRPAVVAMSIRPPMVSMLVLTTSMPTPRPETEVTAAAVENPAWKMNLATWASVIRSTSAWATSPRSTAFWRIAARLRPLPSSAISIVIVPPSW